MPLDIYISSIAFSNFNNIDEIIEIAKKYNLAIEFSSGLSYDKLMPDKYIYCSIKRMPHNYFPAPELPFVLNLASSNNQIREKSIEHCIKGLKLAKASSSPFFSAHIGFCIDPSPFELGRKLEYQNSFNRELHFDLFLKSLRIILDQAEKDNVDFLIENNVITSFNIKQGVNPLLGCNSEELIKILNKINSSKLGLLLDTAHLKVSCNTLNLNIINEVNNLEKYVKCIHHSDNDGLLDSNLKIDKNYWFLPFMKKFNKLPHVIEVKQMDINIIFSQIKILESYDLQRAYNKAK